MVVIADDSKRVDTLGAFPLPVEVVRFGWPLTQRAVDRAARATWTSTAGGVALRMGTDGPLVTDEGHYILDLHLGRIGDPPALAAALNAIPGVVEHGLFIGIGRAPSSLGRADGAAEVLLRAGGAAARRRWRSPS